MRSLLFCYVRHRHKPSLEKLIPLQNGLSLTLDVVRTHFRLDLVKFLLYRKMFQTKAVNKSSILY